MIDEPTTRRIWKIIGEIFYALDQIMLTFGGEVNDEQPDIAGDHLKMAVNTLRWVANELDDVRNCVTQGKYQGE